MGRKSTILTKHDSAGDYEVEIFDCPEPKRVIVCAHGNGVRRWDGEKFFYAVAEHYADSAVLLVDQNQPDGDGVRLNPFPVLVSRVQGLISEAKRLHPGVPVVVMGHSMGCGVITQLKLADVDLILLVTPGAGNVLAAMVARYGEDVLKGKVVKTLDGLNKVFTAEYVASVKGLVWEDEYAKLAERFQPIYVFEAGDEEVVSDDRFVHRKIPFTKYFIIDGAKHNLTGKPLTDFFAKLDSVLA